MVEKSLGLKDTGNWKLSEARKKIKGQTPEDKIYHYAYRPFDTRFICNEPIFIDRPRLPFMINLLNKNLGLTSVRMLSKLPFSHAFISGCLTNGEFVSVRTKERAYIFPLYLYPKKPKEPLFDIKGRHVERILNFTPALLQAIKEYLGKEPVPEDIFSYIIYAVLYSPAYRKRYEEFLKIDFPRIPLPSDYRSFQRLSKLGQELIDLHLLKHPAVSSTEISFPTSGSNKVEKVIYEEKTKRVHINKDQYFANVIKDVWEYRIGAYQVMEKYLKDRKGRKLSLDEINHYLKIAKAIRLTMEIQKKIDKAH
jgi:predicted helicase